MLRLLGSFLAVALFSPQIALAEENKGDDFAQYGIHLGVSPFGGALNFAYNVSPKTSWLIAVGGLPGAEFDLKIGDTDYTVEASSSWVGCFVNHRPFESAGWFRLVAGIGIGNIENELKDKEGNRYRADYTENPVGYVGLGFGSQATKGFSIGFDLGVLHTAGPQVYSIGATTNPEALEEISDDLFFGSALPNAQLTLGWGF